MSIEPIHATASASIQPGRILSVMERLLKLGARTRTRQGCFDPSLTT